MIKKLIDYLFKISGLTIFLILIHYFVFENSSFSLQNNLIQRFYMFLTLLNLFTFYVLLRVDQKKSEYVGYTFLGFVLIKMVVSFVFLYPIIKANMIDKEKFILIFFALYFIYLIFETVSSMSLINKKLS
jgi:hypothetical protein